jgi:hypothetical protein
MELSVSRVSANISEIALKYFAVKLPVFLQEGAKGFLLKRVSNPLRHCVYL